MVDRAVILRKLSELDVYLGQIREYAGVSLQTYRSDWKIQRIVERTLQMMVETCADIANHLIADGGMRAPTGYADTFSVLMENAVTDSALSETMVRMAKFRNVVVHQYEGVDAEIVISVLTRHLNDFVGFRDAILRYLKKTS